MTRNWETIDNAKLDEFLPNMHSTIVDKSIKELQFTGPTGRRFRIVPAWETIQVQTALPKTTYRLHGELCPGVLIDELHAEKDQAENRRADLLAGLITPADLEIEEVELYD